MTDTNITFFIGETRAIELEITDNSFHSVPISGAFYEIYNEKGSVIIEESVAVISDINKIAMILTDEMITKTGVYFIIWKIIALNQEFKIRTQLYIKDII